MPHGHNDLFTENPTRLIGYSAGFANAFGPMRLSRYLYLVTTGFIFSHTVYDPVVMNISTNAPADKLTKKGIDTLVYEVVASGLFPPAFARLVRGISMTRLHKNFGVFSGPVISAITITSLLVVSRPADNAINSVLECSMRKIV